MDGAQGHVNRVALRSRNYIQQTNAEFGKTNDGLRDATLARDLDRRGDLMRERPRRDRAPHTV